MVSPLTLAASTESTGTRSGTFLASMMQDISFADLSAPCKLSGTPDVPSTSAILSVLSFLALVYVSCVFLLAPLSLAFAAGACLTLALPPSMASFSFITAWSP